MRPQTPNPNLLGGQEKQQKQCLTFYVAVEHALLQTIPFNNMCLWLHRTLTLQHALSWLQSLGPAFLHGAEG